MALMVLVLVGLTFGWLSSVLARTEAAGSILRQIGLAMAASVAVGLYANNMTMMGGLSPAALGFACAAATAVLAAYHVLVRSRTSEV
ncbi:hypothetical protein [Erythrobacter sp. YT30]|uniref:hypothetical protein n=1 Tax=Erythrobacter sp. YT30 TaxID=1735012 RepID=UPI00076CC06B|nr:hypothetical protein [Erythrobacter sp. YT30]KWV91557.1 hypothetical protein AUC45_10010 [Erythrobacter sp. YT30]